MQNNKPISFSKILFFKIRTVSYGRSVDLYLPSNIYLFQKKAQNMFKFNNKDTKTTSDVVLVSLLLTLNMFYTFSSASVVDFKQVNIC